MFHRETVRKTRIIDTHLSANFSGAKRAENIKEFDGCSANWLGGRDSEPFASSVSETRRFPQDVPTTRTNERERVSLAGRQGFEPRYRGPEPRVLPLDDLPVPVAVHRVGGNF